MRGANLGSPDLWANLIRMEWLCERKAALLGELGCAAISEGMRSSDMDEGANKVVGWTPEKYRRFRRVYDQAIDAGGRADTVIKFEGDEYVLGYAYYLIQYLTPLMMREDPLRAGLSHGERPLRRPDQGAETSK